MAEKGQKEKPAHIGCDKARHLSAHPDLPAESARNTDVGSLVFCKRFVHRSVHECGFPVGGRDL